MPDRIPFSNGCKVPLQGPHRFRICGINPQLGIVSELIHLAGEAEVQVIDINDKKEGPQTDPCGIPLLTAVQSEGTPLTMTLCLLPANQFSIQCPGLEPSSWAFCEGLYRRLCVSPKRLHPRPSNGHTHRTRIGKSQGGLKHKTYPDGNRVGSCWWGCLSPRNWPPCPWWWTQGLFLGHKSGWWVCNSPCPWGDPFWGWGKRPLTESLGASLPWSKICYRSGRGAGPRHPLQSWGLWARSRQSQLPCQASAPSTSPRPQVRHSRCL